MTDSDRQKLTTMLRHNEQTVWLATSEIRRCFRSIGRAVVANQSDDKISRLIVHINELFVLLLEMIDVVRIVDVHPVAFPDRPVDQ